MDEEQNNEQSLAEKASDTIQDTKDAVRDGANLAKNVSTGNVLGAVKNGFSLLKNKKVRIAIISAILIPIIVVVSLAMSLFSIFDTIGNTIQSVINSFVNLFTADDSWDGSITIKDDDIKKVIDNIQEMGFDMDDLWLLGDIETDDTDTDETLKAKQEEASKKYVRKFLEAQLVTETPHYEPVIASGNAYNQKTYGQVYIYRANDQEYINENSKATPMSWMSYSTMQEEAAKNNEKGLNTIKNHYSIDDEGKLVIAQWTKIETTGKADEVIISLKHIDYKSAISQYTTPMNFFIYLTMVSQNPEFVSAVTDMVKNSRIELTIMDTETVNVEEEKYSYIRNSKTTTEKKHQGTVTGKSTSKNEPRNMLKTTKITTTTVIPTVKITYAKTWFSEQRITYKIEQQTPYHNYEKNTANEDSSLADDQEPGDPSAGKTVEWNTNKCREFTTDVTGTMYKEETRGNVINKIGEKGSQGVTKESYKNEKRQVKNNFVVDDKTTFLGLLDDYFKIPNSNRYEAAGKTNMVSGAEWLFGLMEKDGRLQNLEQVMRYIMYKYTDKDYGVTELDLSIFNIKDFSEVSGVGSLKSFIRYFEGTREEGGQYVVYKDSAGNRTVGYGVNIEAQGSRFIARGIDPSTLKEGDRMDNELVDSIEEEILSEMKASVETATNGLGLKPYQIIALVSRYYNCGNIVGFKDAYNKYWNEKDNEYGIAENDAMYNHALYKNYMNTPTKDSEGNILAGLVTRRKAEWLLFKTGYNIATHSFTPEGGAIIEWAQIIHQYMEENNYVYCVYGGNEYEECNTLSRGSHYLSPTFEGSKTSPQTRKSCCATFVSWVLQEAGYLTTEEHTDGVETLELTLETKKGFTKVSKSELKPGDIVIYSGHVEIYAGNGQVYNAGSGNAIRSAAPNGGVGVNSCLYGLRAPQ